MSHTSIHDDDRDHRQESSMTSLVGIDAVASTDESHERAVLLDVERDSSTHYGTASQLTNGGEDYFLLITPF